MSSSKYHSKFFARLYVCMCVWKSVITVCICNVCIFVCVCVCVFYVYMDADVCIHNTDRRTHMHTSKLLLDMHKVYMLIHAYSQIHTTHTHTQSENNTCSTHTKTATRCAFPQNAPVSKQDARMWWTSMRKKSALNLSTIKLSTNPCMYQDTCAIMNAFTMGFSMALCGYPTHTESIVPVLTGDHDSYRIILTPQAKSPTYTIRCHMYLHHFSTPLASSFERSLGATWSSFIRRRARFRVHTLCIAHLTCEMRREQQRQRNAASEQWKGGWWVSWMHFVSLLMG